MAAPRRATPDRRPSAGREPGRAPASDAVPSRIHDAQAPLLRHLAGFHAVHLLAFGEETGAFRQLAGAGPHGLNVAEFAERQGWVEPYARSFLEAAFALGVLDLTSEAGVTPRARYRMSESWSALLTDEEGPAYAGDTARLAVLAGRDYARFPDLFRSGKTFPWALHGEDFLRLTAATTRSLPDLLLAEALPRLPELRARLAAGAHVLDVGCGAGWGVARIAEAFPRCRVVGIDAEPNALDMAKTLLAFRHLQSRAEARLVRGEELDYESEFDVATLVLVLHTIPPAQRDAALRAVGRALRSDGLLLVHEEAAPATKEEFRGERGYAALEQWLEGTWGHAFLEPGALRDLLTRNGYAVLRTLRLGRDVVVLARRTPPA